MTTISPLLQNRINGNKSQTPNNRHEKIYQDLQKRANEVHPNEAKAVMVKEGILGNPITATVDTFKDGVNFFKAVKTGEMGDNNLGRINDLGLKIGSLIIATFLAAHSKTKTESIMRFVGGGAFIAAMSLWPKLFINLPARLVHGFRIDRKYISAQGDKKDYFIDNQFIVKDARDEKELRKEAKRAGIDYDSKNGREKIEEKERKTALQNRTLWMATAGGATPLMTALFGDFVEPKVQAAVVKSGFNKVKQITDSGISEYIQQVTPKAVDSKALDSLFEQYQGKALDDNFFKQAAEILTPSDIFGQFKDSDDLKAFKGYSPRRMMETLQELRKSGNFSEYNKDELETLLRKSLSIVAKDATQYLEEDDEILNSAKQATETLLNDTQVKEIMNAIGDDLSIKHVLEVLESPQFALAPKSKDNILETAKTNDEKFFKFIKEYNDGPLAAIKARVRAYIDLINPVVGSKAESVYTQDFTRSTTKVLEVFGYDYKKLKEIGVTSNENAIDILSKTISEKVANLNDDEYKAFLASLQPKVSLEGVQDVVDKLKDSKNLESIIADLKLQGYSDDDVKKLTQAVLGSNGASDDGLLRIIKDFIEVKEIDINAIKSKAIICANFERRLAQGDLKDVFNADELGIARKILYDGTISVAKCKGYDPNKHEYEAIIKKLFDVTQFGNEKEVVSNIDKTVENLYKIFKNSSSQTPTKDYLACGSFMDIAKKCARSIGNHKTWQRIFIPMAIALVAVTLLAQPFFGNIKKEFPEDKKGGGAK